MFTCYKEYAKLDHSSVSFKVTSQTYEPSCTSDRVATIVLQIGQTKVFLRSGQMAELDAHRALKQATAVKTIQKESRRHISRRDYVSLQKAAICLQSLCRGLLIIISLPCLSHIVDFCFEC